MKEHWKFSLFFGGIFTAVLVLALKTWGYETISLPMVLGIFLVMTLLSLLAMAGTSREVKRRMEDMEAEFSEEETKEEETEPTDRQK